MTHGLGRHFESPRHSRDKTRTNATVNIPGQASKHCYALARLAQLQSKTTITDSSELCHHSSDFPWESKAVDGVMMDEEYVPSDTDHDMQGGEQYTAETQPTTSMLDINHCCGMFTTLRKRKAHYSRLRSTLVPSVACQTTEGEYLLLTSFPLTDTL